MLFIVVLNGGNHFFSFPRGFSLITAKQLHENSQVKPSKYDSTSGTKFSICLKTIEGMRLSIGTSTF